MHGVEAEDTDSVVAVSAAAQERGPGASYLLQELWTRLGEARSYEAFAQAWLDIMCPMLPGAVEGLVVLGPAEEGPFVPVAYWPESAHDSLALSSVAELAMAERRGALAGRKRSEQGEPSGHDAIAYPLIVDGQLYGVAAVQLNSAPEPELRANMRQLQWGTGWLEALVRRKVFATRDQLVSVLSLATAALEQTRFHAAATALATELAMELKCDRVSVGFLRGRHHAHVEALSHSAEFSRRSGLMRAIGACMDEALDQQETIVYPESPTGHLQVTRAHAELARLHGAGAICSVPLVEGDRMVGALTMERPADQPFDAATISVCEHLASLLGPVLELKRRDDRWFPGKVADAVLEGMGRLFGPRHLGLKLSGLLLAALVAFFMVAEGTYRISADAMLEGKVQRVVTAPTDGYIAEALVRAGDTVQAGDILCRLDDRDLQLDRLKWASQKEQQLREYSNALADHDRAQVRILGAQVEQAEAQLALLDEQLARTRIVAPFDGFVVSGDLTQSLGAPVERGDVLFEIAPLHAYRVILNVDEREIVEVEPGQRGRIALSGLPHLKLPVSVEKITPVAVADEGRNYFRVEAALAESPEVLRPGMEGVAKLDVEQRKLIWIWTHKLVAWLRMWLWSWWP